MDLAQVEGPGSWVENYRLRAVLALQHLWRIGEAMQVNWWLGAVAFLARGEHANTQAQVAWRLWERMHALPDNEDEDDDDGPQLDAWDIKYGRRTEELTDAPVSSLPQFTALVVSHTSIPPFLAVQVDELPRGSDIEWQGLGGRCEQVKLDIKGGTSSTTMDNQYKYTNIEIDAGSSEETLKQILRSVNEAYRRDSSLSQAVLYTTYPVPEPLWPVQVVPCRSVWGREGRRLSAGVVLQQLS
jgi:diphthine-ammonia ligase